MGNAAMIKEQFPHFSLEPRGSDRAVQHDETSPCVVGTQTRQKFISDERNDALDLIMHVNRE